MNACPAASLSRLAWHYRSRNEGLITFSNHQYHGLDLVTFLSPKRDTYGFLLICCVCLQLKIEAADDDWRFIIPERLQ